MADVLVHDDRFTEAFANTQHRVFGKRLDPFCLWHQLNLELINSPLVTGDVVRPIDLIAACAICTTPFSSAGYVPDLSPKRGLARLFEILRLSRYRFTDEFKKFEASLRDFQSGPKLWPNQHKRGCGGPRDMDEILEYAAHVIQETGYSERVVWTMPIGKLHWYSTAFLKLKGAEIMIWTPIDEEQFQIHLKKREAKLQRITERLMKEEGLPRGAARKKAETLYWSKVRQFFQENEKKASPK